MASYVDGDEELIAILSRAPRKAVSALSRAMYRQAQKIMKHSREDYVPIDNERLKTSGVVAPAPIIEAGVITVLMGYGGVAINGKEVNYAVIQHEDTSLSHPPKNPGRKQTKQTSRPGRAKYLEQAVLDYAPSVPAYLASQCDKMFRKEGL